MWNYHSIHAVYLKICTLKSRCKLDDRSFIDQWRENVMLTFNFEYHYTRNIIWTSGSFHLKRMFYFYFREALRNKKLQLQFSLKLCDVWIGHSACASHVYVSSWMIILWLWLCVCVLFDKPCFLLNFTRQSFYSPKS